MNATHTPGPWNYSHGWVCCNGTQDADDKVAGEISSKADGALIAAAPELLQALRALVAAVDDVDADSCFEMAAARAAIARAEGQS